MADNFQEKELRAFVDMKLREPAFLKELYKELRATHTKDEIEKMDSEDIYRFIVKHGLLEHLVMQQAPKSDSQWLSGDVIASPDIALEDIQLKMTIVEGNGFTDYLEKNDAGKRLLLSISFLKNRRVSRPVQTSVRPVIDQVGAT